MENATKALMIAAGVLLALLILSAAVVLYVSLQKNTNSYVEKVESTKISQYNSRFEAYRDKREVTITEIFSLVNYADERGSELGANTTVKINNSLINLHNLGYQDKINYIKTCVDINFYCDSISYDTRGIANEIVFKQN